MIIPDMLARGVLKSMDWVKHEGITGKVNPWKQLLAEEKFAFQISTSKVVYEHDIPSELTINLGQTLLSYVSPGKYLLNIKGAKNVLVKGIGDKRQITPTFSVSAFGDFQPTRLNCKGNTRRCFLSFLFPRNFNMTFTKNHWSKHRECWAFFFF